MNDKPAASTWHEVTAAAEMIAQAARTGERTTTTGSQEELAAARDALLLVTAAGKKLARLLDTLADHYNSPGAAEPSAVHVALDQAAAAAEDLGTCTKVAAHAIEDQK